MILEERVKEVSNRPSQEFDLEFSNRIKSAVEIISNKKEPEIKLSPKNKPEDISNKENLEIDSNKEITDLREQYGLLEEQNLLGVDYENLFSYLEHQTNPEELYNPEESGKNENLRVMSDEEAEETIQKIQLSYLTGNKEELPPEEKEKFHYWQEFNKTLLMLYHQLSPIRSDNINYSRLN
jgi:hypothetical protein